MNRRGAALAEVLITALILGILLPTLGMMTMRMMEFHAWNRDRAVAVQITRNEVERLRALGPDAAAATVGTTQLDRAGDPDPEGRFRREITAGILCLGGEEVGGRRPSDIDPNPCEGDRYPIIAYRVGLYFPVRNGEHSVQYELRMSDQGRFGDAIPLSQ